MDESTGGNKSKIIVGAIIISALMAVAGMLNYFATKSGPTSTVGKLAAEGEVIVQDVLQIEEKQLGVD